MIRKSEDFRLVYNIYPDDEKNFLPTAEFWK